MRRAIGTITLVMWLFVALSGGRIAEASEEPESIFRDARAYTVRVKTRISTPFIEDEAGSFEGAGFLVDADQGWILTNAHVVGQSPAHVEVAFVDGVYRAAQRLYVDSFTDVAVLRTRVDPRSRVAPIDCGRVPEIGEGIGVFGHPFGMAFTGTRGIVSGKTDQLRNDLLQVDATVNQGNSGGPVISLRDGRIVGIATSGMSGSKADRVNFATPMKDVCRILELLRAGHPPEPPLLEFGLLLDEDGRHTLEVARTYDAARWPFQPGDRIVAVGSEATRVRTLTGLVSSLRGREPGVPVRVVRSGHEVELHADPARRPSVVGRRAVYVDGAIIAPLAIGDWTSLNEPAQLVVHSVEPGSAAEAAGLEKLDIVESVDGIACDSLEALQGYLGQRPAGLPIRVWLRRLSESHSRWFEDHVRELPGSAVRTIPDHPALAGAGP